MFSYLLYILSLFCAEFASEGIPQNGVTLALIIEYVHKIILFFYLKVNLFIRALSKCVLIKGGIRSSLNKNINIETLIPFAIHLATISWWSRAQWPRFVY